MVVFLDQCFLHKYKFWCQVLPQNPSMRSRRPQVAMLVAAPCSPWPYTAVCTQVILKKHFLPKIFFLNLGVLFVFVFCMRLASSSSEITCKGLRRMRHLSLTCSAYLTFRGRSPERASTLTSNHLGFMLCRVPQASCLHSTVNAGARQEVRRKQGHRSSAPRREID